MAATIARLEADIKDLKNENTALWMEMEGLKKSLKALNVPVYTSWG
jgi:regulator of replication initiation timing